MADEEPLAEPFNADDARPPTPWAVAQRRLEEAQTYWLATAFGFGTDESLNATRWCF